MIEIKYRCTDDGYELEALGHANYAEAGKDIVCAGVSTLIQTLCFSTDAQIINMEPGNVHIRQSGEKAVAAFKVILTGLEAIAKTYPDHVGVDYK